MNKMTPKAARVNANLTQQEAADNLQIARSTLSRIEQNSKVSRLWLLEKMAELYHIKTEDFKLEKGE